MTTKRDYYEVLGISKSASNAEMGSLTNLPVFANMLWHHPVLVSASAGFFSGDNL